MFECCPYVNILYVSNRNTPVSTIHMRSLNAGKLRVDVFCSELSTFRLYSDSQLTASVHPSVTLRSRF